MNKFIIAFLVLIMMLTSYDAVSAQQKDMLVYFGIEIVPEYLDEYQNHLERRISSYGDIGVGRDRYFPAA
jgi:hypothetical protein